MTRNLPFKPIVSVCICLICIKTLGQGNIINICWEKDDKTLAYGSIFGLWAKCLYLCHSVAIIDN